MNEIRKRVSLHTLGCRLNIAETGTIAEVFTSSGYDIVQFGAESDVVVINTCTVTDKADSSCRNLIRKAVKCSPGAKVIVVGCYSQVDPDSVAQIEGVDLVLGTSEKYKLFEYLESLDDCQIVCTDESGVFVGAKTTSSDSHTRAFLKIQDGCDYYCSYCIIPYARGNLRGITIDEAVKSVEQLLADGFKEIVLTGVNIGEYYGPAGESLSDLVKHILEVEGDFRLRLSSIEPNKISDELLTILSGSPKAMAHFHIPLQSGDDEILQLMGRKYSTTDFKIVVEKIRKYFPDSSIGTDVITGFPGESEEHFKNGVKLLSELKVEHFHIFPYSVRKGTKAADLPGHIEKSVKKERARELITIGEKKLSEFSKLQVGREANVLFERRNRDGLFEGYTENYLRVVVDIEEDLSNRIIKVQLIKFDGSIVGECIS